MEKFDKRMKNYALPIESQQKEDRILTVKE